VWGRFLPDERKTTVGTDTYNATNRIQMETLERGRK
jgi:hypothetical protein